MKISYNWLKEIYPTDLSPEAIDALLTAGGLEVESVEEFESVKGGMKGLVVGEVKTCIKHPDADKLKLTTVDVGTGENLQIVCGGPNVAAGQKVVVALPGTKIFPLDGEPFVIKLAKIRGQSSNGMICAEDEIGLSHSHAGVIVLPDDTKVGTPAADYYKIKSDFVFEIGLTPNRADAASHLGVARDLAAVVRAKLLIETGKDVKKALIIPPVKELKKTAQKEVKVIVEDTKSCLRYTGISIANVLVGESPAWLKDRLTSIGVHPINNIVDITNYVLHEYGQPLHAFDIDSIKGNKIVVRSAKPGEKFTTLDKVERSLAEGDLMICDESTPMCLAGVFGGLNSGITEKTKNVFLESACFSPGSIRKTSKRHGLKTDASFRFERGTDPEITVGAMNRAATMVCEIAGGEIASEVVDIYPEKVLPAVFEISYNYLDRFSGEVIDRKVIQTILESLDIKIISSDSEKLKIEVPAFKVDVSRPVDVVEEILRIYGYDRIPVREKISMSLPGVVEINKENFQHKIAEYLSANGFNEIISNSLVKKEYATLDSDGESTAVNLLNPLSQELSILRRDLLTTALETVLFNLNRKQNNLKLFEFGKIYFKNENKYKENYRFSLLLTGNKNEESWKVKEVEVDFYLLKAYVKNILTLCGIEDSLEMESSHHAFTQGMIMQKNKETLVDFGMVSKSMLKKFDISQSVFYAELHWDTILKYARKKPIRYKEVSKFPAVKRDLSMLVRNEISYQQLEKIAFDAEKKLLIDIRLFDVYDGDKIEAGKKSCALSFILQDDQQTLTDQQINKVMDRLMAAYEREAGAEIRRS
jgi:phenylalanyl-tRNA synthetase beta chain